MRETFNKIGRALIKGIFITVFWAVFLYQLLKNYFKK